MVMSSAAGTNFQANDTRYEIYDLGSNTIQAAYQLELVASNAQNAKPYFNDPTSNWQIVGLGGFNGGDTSDILMRDVGGDSNIGAFSIFDMSNNNASGGAIIGQVGVEWQVAGFGDFSGNANETDMLMRDSNNGAFELYDISNNQLVSASGMGTIGLEWQTAAVAANMPNGSGGLVAQLAQAISGSPTAAGTSSNSTPAEPPSAQLSPLMITQPVT
jgi:hypothetical protein